MKRNLSIAALIGLALLVAVGCTAGPGAVETPAADTPVVTVEPQEAATDTSAPAVTEEQATVTTEPTAEPEATDAPADEGDTARLYLIALEAGGEEGESIGCGDALVPVEVELDPSLPPLEAALSALLAIDEEFYGQSGLYNALYQSDLTVAGIQMEPDRTIIALEGDLVLGGTCDSPRIRAQLEQTALQFDDVPGVEFLINGEPLNAVIAGDPVQAPTPGGPGTVEEVFMYMVLRDDAGRLGRLFGCNDSLMPVLLHLDPTLDPLTDAMQQLAGVQSEFYGRTQLYNSLYQSELRLRSAEVSGDGVARIAFEGHVEIAGECDLPRFRTQLEQTALQFDDVNEVEITINGEPLETITGGAQGGLAPQAQAVGSVVQVYLVAPETEGGFGCGDSLVAIEQPAATPGAPLQSALGALFTLDPSLYEPLGLYNVFAQSNLTIERVSIDNGTATIALRGDLLLGGVCDNPRVLAQIEATATQFDTVDAVVVTLNGQPIEDVLSLR